MRHGAGIDPPNRFETTRTERELEHVAWDDEYLQGLDRRPITYLPDTSHTIVVENDSPDINFRYSVNPYRGCAHGCAYCYARNTHEYLGMNAGLDFETRIMVKHDAPRLLRDFLARDSWRGEFISFSGVTDCYQPAEREYRLTRGCLEVALECHQAVGIVTKNALVVRDLDLLQPLAAENLVHVYLSINSLDLLLARDMEPRTSTPAARLRAVEELTKAGIPTGVICAPIIPGLNDHEAPSVIAAARGAGAIDVRYILLRLPLTVEPVFREWLGRARPTHHDKVENFIRQSRGGKLNSSKWGERHRGTGQRAEQIAAMFEVFRKKHGCQNMPPLDQSKFRPARPTSGQQWLF